MKQFYDAREGLVELEDDVLSVVRQIRELYGHSIRVCHEPTTGEFVLSERCEDGEERLIFTTPVLDARVIDRLLRADKTLRGYVDPYDQQEREYDELLATRDQQALDRLGDAGERLAWAMEEDGKGTGAQILVTRDIHADS